MFRAADGQELSLQVSVPFPKLPGSGSSGHHFRVIYCRCSLLVFGSVEHTQPRHFHVGVIALPKTAHHSNDIWSSVLWWSVSFDRWGRMGLTNCVATYKKPFSFVEQFVFVLCASYFHLLCSESRLACRLT